MQPPFRPDPRKRYEDVDWGGGGGRRQSREEEWSEEQVRPPWFGKSVPLLLSKVLEQPSENLTVMCRLTGRSESSADILIRTRSSPLTWSTWYIFFVLEKLGVVWVGCGTYHAMLAAHKLSTCVMY